MKKDQTKKVIDQLCDTCGRPFLWEEFCGYCKGRNDLVKEVFAFVHDKRTVSVASIKKFLLKKYSGN